MVKRTWMMTGIGALALFLAGAGVAQDSVEASVEAAAAAAAAAESATVDGLGFVDAVGMGINVVYAVLGLFSVLAVALIIYFLAVVRRGVMVPEQLRSELIEKLQGGGLDEARQVCRHRPCPLASVVLAAIDHVQRVPSGDPLLLRDAVEAEGSRQSEAVQGQVSYLMDIAVISPMLGLLGTVLGMLLAFDAVSTQVSIVRPAELSGGLIQAMMTTAFGLVVGIPSMIFYAVLRRRASKLISLLEGACADVFGAMVGRRSDS
jgi:biopolymer transport protein ExbB